MQQHLDVVSLQANDTIYWRRIKPIIGRHAHLKMMTFIKRKGKPRQLRGDLYEVTFLYITFTSFWRHKRTAVRNFGVSSLTSVRCQDGFIRSG